MKHRNSYHSTIKLAYALDVHKTWLPDSFIKSIPRSSSFAWKFDTTEKFVGHQHAMAINDNVEELKLLYDEKVALEKRLFVSYTRIKIIIIQFFGEKQYKAFLKENFREVLRFIYSSKNTFDGGVKSICKFLEIHTNSFTYWKKAIEVHCANSPIGVCLKKVPSQVTLKEIQTIRELLNRKKFSHWPIASVWAYAVRNDLVRLSLSSWYRYNKKYKFRKRKPKFDKRKDYDPLRAERPNHTWHADITIVKTVDGLRNYVYLIVDLYSKLIINWKADKKCNGKVRTQTIREAVLQEFGTDLTLTSQIDLIVDGGTENNNQTVEAFIKQSNVDITKKIALKDIKQSNSMVEASNKILKHQYLFKQPIADFEHLQEHLKGAVEDFNTQRPHCVLGLYTPSEVHYDKRPKIDTEKIKQEVKERVKINLSNGCGAEC